MEDLNSPFGMALVGSDLYVANTDAVMRFPYTAGNDHIDQPGAKLTDLPARPASTITGPRARREPRRHEALCLDRLEQQRRRERPRRRSKAAPTIREIDLASGQWRVFAMGLAQSEGMALEPQTGALWAVVNERDELGSDLVPDYLTSVKEGAFYGWPYSYWGQHVDARVKPPNPDMVAKAIAPDYALGNHVAALGLAFAQGHRLPQPFANGAFIGEHGSWNRKPPVRLQGRVRALRRRQAVGRCRWTCSPASSTTTARR